MKNITLKKCAETLQNADNITILCHRYPDGDCIGSAFALCAALHKLGKQAKVRCCHEFPKKFDFITKQVEFSEFGEQFVVAVDVASLSQLGDLEQEYSGRVDLCIDHHKMHTPYAKKLLIEPNFAAAGEIIFSLINAMGIQFDQLMLNALYTAVSTDTGCFKYSNCNAQTMRIAADLMELGADTVLVNKLMFDTKSRKRIALERKLYETLGYYHSGRVAVMALLFSAIEETGAGEDDIDGLANLPRQIEGVDIGILMRETEGGFKISARTSPPYDVSAVCAKFGGGGHAGAAGCTILGSYEEVLEKISSAVGEALRG